ncbi:MAG: oxygen-independent coproporphyrinogen III oxidase [Ectothiorhodospiraceae bacterium]|nr:oxygen-independent coproporphyrinogen III oxidase [Chromatiales bacterium]MCP5153757.1 oxygen-independent coproporphyrinogen III oxidase [Ectothiorhodospiraceae bacterium]
MHSQLVAKYDVPGPRYTSYPTVPYWESEGFGVEAWRDALAETYAAEGRRTGIAVYVHLPYCESLCTFCGCTKHISRSHAVEGPYVDGLLAEWAQYRRLFDADLAVREIHLGGGTPTFFSPASLARLVDGLLAGTRPADDHEFGFEAHPNSTSREHLERLHELGFRRLSLGVQDFDPVVQTAIHRHQPLERVREVTEQARALGYASVNYDLVYGLPKQRIEGVRSTVRDVLALRPDRIAYYGYAHVPWVKGVGQRGFVDADIPRGADKRALYEAGRTMLEDAGYEEVGLDHFALPDDGLARAWREGRLARSFMGYTESRTRICVGLGMSAIGDAWGAFAQNEKKVATYLERVGRGELPLLRGHRLNAEDLVLRRHIHEVMCRFETSWDEAEGAMPALRDAVAELAPLAEDGIVELGSNRVRVTARGRPFLRNVCMAFDARLRARAPTAPTFSQAI